MEREAGIDTDENASISSRLSVLEEEAIVNVMWDEFKRKLSDEEESFVKLIELNEKGFVAKEIMQMLGKSKTWYYDSWKMIHKRWIDYNKD